MSNLNKYIQFAYNLGIKNILNYNFIFVAQRLLGLIFVLLIANNMSKQEYGIFSYFIVIQYFIVELSHLGLPIIIIKKITQNINKKNNLVYGIVIFSLIFSLLLNLLLFGIINLFNLGLTASAFSLFLVICLTSLNYIFVAFLSSIDKVNLGHFLEAVLKISIILLIVFLYLYPQNLINFQNIIYAYLIANFLVLIFFFYFFYINFLEKIKFESLKFEFKNYFSSIFFLGISSIILLLNTKIDILMLDFFFNKEIVASYNIATQVAFIPYISILSLYAILAPKISLNLQKKKEKIIAISIVFYRALVFIIIFFSLLIYYFYLEDLIIILFNLRYLDSYYPALILVLFYFLLCPFIFSDLILKLNGNEKKITLISLISASLNLILNIFFIPKYGMIGASIATGLSFLVFHLGCFSISKNKNFFLFLLLKFFFSKKKYQINFFIKTFFKIK